MNARGKGGKRTWPAGAQSSCKDRTTSRTSRPRQPGAWRRPRRTGKGYMDTMAASQLLRPIAILHRASASSSSSSSSRAQTHVSMLWTVILGRVEWKDLAKLSRVEVDRGMLDCIAVLTTGRRNCLVAEYIGYSKKRGGCKGEDDGGGQVLLYTIADTNADGGPPEGVNTLKAAQQLL